MPFVFTANVTIDIWTAQDFGTVPMPPPTIIGIPAAKLKTYVSVAQVAAVGGEPNSRLLARFFVSSTVELEQLLRNDAGAAVPIIIVVQGDRKTFYIAQQADPIFSGGEVVCYYVVATVAHLQDDLPSA